MSHYANKLNAVRENCRDVGMWSGTLRWKNGCLVVSRLLEWLNGDVREKQNVELDIVEKAMELSGRTS
jgi:hypothetical protein